MLGFPCNQFGSQESGTEDEIGEFCQVNYGVTFPMFAKVDVNGNDAHPLFTWLKGEKKGLLGGKIKWNFTKFLVGRDGQVIGRYAPTTEPKDIADDIRAALAADALHEPLAPPGPHRGPRRVPRLRLAAARRRPRRGGPRWVR